MKKKSIKWIAGILIGLIIVLLMAAWSIYYKRWATAQSIEKITEYEDGYDLYKIEIKYDYSLQDVIDYGIKDNQSFIDAIIAESLPYLPVHIKAPNFGCSAFRTQESDGTFRMGRNYDLKNDTSAMMVHCKPKDGYESIGFTALDNLQANQPGESMKKKLACITAPFICLDGLNEKGVSIAVLTLDSEPVFQSRGKEVIGTTLAYDCEDENREMKVTKIDAITNFYGAYIDRVEPNQKNGIYGHGRERYDSIVKVLDEAGNDQTEQMVWDALRASSQDPNPNDVTSNTQWPIVYNNTEKTAKIAIRRKWNQVTEFDIGGKIK